MGKLDRCFKSYDFSGNVLIGNSGPWPKNNPPPANLAKVISSSNLGLLRSLQLLPASPFSNGGTDGKNPGADIAAVQATISGVAP
jgi:hypothetical protein